MELQQIECGICNGAEADRMRLCNGAAATDVKFSIDMKQSEFNICIEAKTNVMEIQQSECDICNAAATDRVGQLQ